MGRACAEVSGGQDDLPANSWPVSTSRWAAAASASGEGLHNLDVQQALRVERSELVELVVRERHRGRADQTVCDSGEREPSSGPGSGVVTADRDCDRGGVLGVVKHVLLGDAGGGGRGEGFARAEVSRIAGVGAARDLNPKAVAFREAVGGGPELDRDAACSVWLLGAGVRVEVEDAVGDVERFAGSTVGVAG